MAVDLSFGASGDWFGHRDYTGNLKKIWDANDPGVDRQKKLMAERQKILSWMKDPANQSKIREHNQLGVDPRDDGSGGLGHRIASGDFSKRFMGTNMDINPETGAAYSEASKNYFGHADLMHSRASGHSWTDILGHLDANKGDLRMRNVPGGGGLYDEVKTQANFEKQTGDWISALGNLKDDFGSAIQGQTEAFNTGMGGVSDAIKSQTESHEKYRADEMSWRRRAEQMQMMQMEEARRQSKAKPIVQVLPGASAFGGGGGGTGAFARKKKQTTGLNIS
tara:strand:+ start:122 stop:958 length:837 start_codon:yes stop_codon:yes gene_type:complete